MPKLHAEVGEFFAQLKDRNDLEAYQHELREPDIRQRFYRKLRAFVQLMHAGESSATWLNEMDGTTAKQLELQGYRRDRKFWLRLRELVRKRFAESIDFGSIEAEIRRILDAHIDVVEIQRLGEPVNIFDESALQEALGEFEGDEAKADKIASETSRHFDEHLDRNKTAYLHYAEQLRAVIEDYHQQHISAAEYLARVRDIRNDVVHGGKADSTPQALRERPRALTLYSNIRLKDAIQNGIPSTKLDAELPQIALDLEAAIADAVMLDGKPIVDWRRKNDVLSDVELLVFDMLYDSSLFADKDERPTHLIGQIARDITVYSVEPTSLGVREIGNRWGTCTPSGRVVLNPRLIHHRRSEIEYVIVHELCHLVVPNHGRRFMDLLRRVMPDYEVRKGRLEYG